MAVSTATMAWRVAMFAAFLGVVGVALSLGLGIPPAVRNPPDVLVETGNITWTLQWLPQSNTTTYQVYLRESGGTKWLIAVFPPPAIFPVPMNAGAATYNISMTMPTPHHGSVLYSVRNLAPAGVTGNGTWVLAPAPAIDAVSYPTAGAGDGGWFFDLVTNTATHYNLTIAQPLELWYQYFVR